jgi:hypothetical protein
MNGETFWQIFSDTGDPMSWLMYRASEKAPDGTKKYTAAPPEPNPGASD